MPLEQSLRAQSGGSRQIDEHDIGVIARAQTSLAWNLKTVRWICGKQRRDTLQRQGVLMKSAIEQHRERRLRTGDAAPAFPEIARL